MIKYFILVNGEFMKFRSVTKDLFHFQIVILFVKNNNRIAFISLLNNKVFAFNKRFQSNCSSFNKFLSVEHLGISNLTEKWVKNMKESAISDHRLQCDCFISFDDFDVLASDNNNFRLLIKRKLVDKTR